MAALVLSGIAYGKGSDAWRGVTHLSKEAKETLSSGSGLVICPRTASGPGGDWYVVVKKTYRNRTLYDHRLPNAAEAAIIAAWEEAEE